VPHDARKLADNSRTTVETAIVSVMDENPKQNGFHLWKPFI